MKGILYQLNVGRGGIPKHPIQQASVVRDRILGDDWEWSVYKIQDNGKPGKHGGRNQAICLYSLECLEALKDQGFPVFAGALGENFTTQGIDMHAVRIGDIYTVGSIEMEITRIRKPCNTIAKAYGATLGKAMMNKAVDNGDVTDPLWGMTGFYAKVLRLGVVKQGDTIERIVAGPEPIVHSEPPE